MVKVFLTSIIYLYFQNRENIDTCIYLIVDVLNLFSVEETIERYRNQVKEVQTDNSSSVEEAQVFILHSYNLLKCGTWA